MSNETSGLTERWEAFADCPNVRHFLVDEVPERGATDVCSDDVLLFIKFFDAEQEQVGSRIALRN